jgi:hypothetical protein
MYQELPIPKIFDGEPSLVVMEIVLMNLATESKKPMISSSVKKMMIINLTIKQLYIRTSKK